MVDALGIVETLGFTAAVQVADAAVKSANIRLGKWVKVGGGRVAIVIRGDVAAVKAAVDAGGQAGRAIGKVESEIIIARPSEKLGPKFKLDPMAAVGALAK
jgi:ethanolamine utilization protein EutM